MSPSNYADFDKTIGLVCPTYNAGSMWIEWISAVKSQSVRLKILIIDSGSSDNTVALAKDAGFEVKSISNKEFNHGSTRNLGADYFGDSVDILVYLTQDAILESTDSILTIVNYFQDSNIGAVCGRQLPRKGAKAIEAHARIFNYPSASSTKSKINIDEIGIKVAFMSNSFAAYQRSLFYDCGKFPDDTIFAEDMSLAARMILKDYKVAYSADATVYHSHNYTFTEEFKRYFDVGVFYSRESWIKDRFGGAGGEGIKYAVSELKYLIKIGKAYLLFYAIIRNILKFIAFKLGGIESHLPKGIKQRLSMNKSYWNR
ncbi:glycosyltransferase [Ekhidna sp.]|uniref:glycosyltransferase family 2 protein n=1 Tax=Ekhidna sp. TaxID=2608089 RepID=UPI00329872FF